MKKKLQFHYMHLYSKVVEIFMCFYEDLGE